jgi:hypothetical protein
MHNKLTLYCQALEPLLKWVSENPDDKDVKYMITRIIRMSLDDPSVFGRPFLYSSGALEEANKRGLPDAEHRLQWTRWKSQDHKAGLQEENRKGGIFHQEHIIPVSQIAKMMYELEDINTDSIKTILENNFKVAWILKTEQKALDSVNRSGMRTPEFLTAIGIYIKDFNC